MPVAGWQRYSSSSPSPISGFTAQGRAPNRDTGYLGDDGLSYSTSKHEFWGDRQPSNAADQVVWHRFSGCWCNYPQCPGSRGGVANYGTYVRPVPVKKAPEPSRPRPRGPLLVEAEKSAKSLAKKFEGEYDSFNFYPFKDRAGETHANKLRSNFYKHDDETGKPKRDKTFLYMDTDGNWGLNGRPANTLPMYGSEHLNNAYTTAYIVIAEGEKKADALISRGIPAVSMPGAAVIPTWEVIQETIRGFDRVVYWRDNDIEGTKGAYRLAETFWDNGAELWDLDWKDAPPKGDAYDFFDLGHTVEEFIDLLKASTLYVDLRPSPERMPDDTARGPVRKAYLEELASKHAHAATQADRLAAVLAQMGPEERNDAVMFRWCRTESVKSMDMKGVHRIAQPLTCKDTICPKCATGRMLAAWRGKVQNRLDGVRGTLLRIYPKNHLGGANPLRTLAKRWQEHRKVLRQNYALWEGVWGYRWDPDYGGCIMLWTRALVSDMLPYMDAWEIEIVADNCYEAPQFGHWLAIEYDAEFSYILERAEAGDTELLLSWRSWVRGRRRFNGFGKIWRPKKEEDFYFPEKGEDPPDPLLVGLEKGLTSRGDQIEGDNVIVVLGRIVGGNRAPKTPQICPGCELKEQVGVRRGYERMLTVDTAQAQGPGGYYLTYFG